MPPVASVSQDLGAMDILPLASQWTDKWTLPLASGQTQHVEDFIKKASVLDLSQLGLRNIPRPVLGADLQLQPVEQRLQSVQEYITAFQYNHTSNTYFDQNKQRPLCRILSTARDIVRQGLPIKCVEAVFLALLLTAGWKDLDRIPVGFKTCVAGHVYRHIVLAVRHPDTGRWGALGLSRRAELMEKSLTYASLADLLQNYMASYMRWWHSVLRIRIGLPVPHDVMYDGQVTGQEWPEVAVKINQHAAKANELWAAHVADRKGFQA